MPCSLLQKQEEIPFSPFFNEDSIPLQKWISVQTKITVQHFISWKCALPEALGGRTSIYRVVFSRNRSAKHNPFFIKIIMKQITFLAVDVRFLKCKATSKKEDQQDGRTNLKGTKITTVLYQKNGHQATHTKSKHKDKLSEFVLRSCLSTSALASAKRRCQPNKLQC